MKKVFEFLIILIIFYGVYSAFDIAAVMIVASSSGLWIIIASLLASGLIVLLYSQVIRNSTSVKYKHQIQNLKRELEEAKHNLDHAFAIKKSVEEEAEKTIHEEE